MKETIMAVICMVALAGTAMAADLATLDQHEQDTSMAYLNGQAYDCRESASVPRPMWQRVLSFGLLGETKTQERDVWCTPENFSLSKKDVADFNICGPLADGMAKMGASYHLACQVEEGRVEMVEVTDKGCGYAWYKGNL